MTYRRTLVVLLGLGLLGLVVRPGGAYVEERYTLPRVVNESTNIVVVKVEKVNKARKLIYYKKIVDLKGKHPTDVIKHNVGVGGFNAFEQKAPIEWAEPGKIAIFFHNGAASETCIGKYWYQAYAGGEWWNHSHGEPYLCRTYCGDIDGLKAAVEKLLKNEDVVVPATVSKTDLRIQKVKASMKKPLDYVVVEQPRIEKVKLDNVAGFSDMIELPRPKGLTQGVIPVDFDNDGYTDLLLIGTRGLVLLRNNQKGNFEDVTDKWGLAADPGCQAAAFADYNRSGRMSLLTSDGRLYTNTGDKFKDDTALLPETPERVNNPGEAFAWLDIDGDGLPDIVCTVGLKGLTAFRNKGGAQGKWFEDVSAKVGLGETGLGLEPANFLTALDLNSDGKTDFVLNLETPLVVLNDNGKFRVAPDSGLMFPAISRPSLAYADYLNNGKLGVFVTANDRRGSLTNWEMIGTFSADEDKLLEAGPDFSPKARPNIKIKDDTWSWNHIHTKKTGALEAGRSQPSPNACYAFTTFEWSRAEKVLIYFGSEDGVTAWLNGKQVYEHKTKRAYHADADKVEVNVKQGENRLLLKVFDERAQWRTSVRVSPIGLYPPAAVQLYENDGKGKFTDVTLKAGDLAQLRADCQAAVWADLDGDGLLDLLVADKSGLLRYYHNLGDGKFRYATAELGLEQKFKAAGVVTADFNNDGALDLVLVGADRDPSVVLISKLKTRRTPLTVRFSGPESSIGALVRVVDEAGKLHGTRHIAGGDGRNMQAAAEARFALATGKYRIETRYSSGKVRVKSVQVANKALWETIDQKTPLGDRK
jgi:hypothetical protein